MILSFFNLYTQKEEEEEAQIDNMQKEESTSGVPLVYFVGQ